MPLSLGSVENEGLATLDGDESPELGLRALELEGDLLGSLGLLLEDRLGLTSEALLLGIVTSLSLDGEGVLALFVLRDLVHRVLPQLRTVSLHHLWNVDLLRSLFNNNKLIPLTLKLQSQNIPPTRFLSPPTFTPETPQTHLSNS